MHRCLMVLTLAWLGIAGSVAAQTAPPTGDQHRRYMFAPTGAEMPYRLYVPSTWDDKRSLPILLFLHGAGANESSYLDMANGLLGMVAFVAAAATGTQQPKAVIEAGQDVARGQGPRPGCGKFDGQRDAIQSGTDGRNHRPVGVVQLEPVSGGGRSFDEQQHRIRGRVQ